jgi:hypothetical protein
MLSLIFVILGAHDFLITINYEKKAVIVMVNNSTNINETNNYISTLKFWLAYGWHKRVAQLIWLMGSQPSSY